MLPHANRLSQSNEVVAVVRHGSGVNGRHLRTVALRPRVSGDGPATQPGRFTVIVSKKTAKLAVTRNRLKRRVREALRGLPVPANCWGTIFPRLSALDAPYPEIQADLKAWLKQWERSR